MSKRRITLAEMQSLNPGVNLDKVEGGIAATAYCTHAMVLTNTLNLW
jgi:hypothetical protein